MFALQIQKIEELTLCITELKKQIYRKFIL